MFELLDIRPQIAVEESEYQRLLGYPKHRTMEGRSGHLAAQTRMWFAAHARPWIYIRQAEGLEVTGEGFRIGDAEFQSKALQRQFADAGVHDAVVVAVCAGGDCDEQAGRLWEAGKPDEYFFLEMYGSAVVEHLIATAAGRVCAWADEQDLAVLPFHSPGFAGWDIRDQKRLWDVIRQEESQDFPDDLLVWETGMLKPKKSLLALFGVTRYRERVRHLARMVPCENCFLSSCPYRRAPYRRAPVQLEALNR